MWIHELRSVAIQNGRNFMLHGLAPIVGASKVMFRFGFSARSMLPSNEQIASQSIWHNRAKKLDFLRPSLVHVVTVVSGCPKSLGEGGGPKEGQPRRAHAGS